MTASAETLQSASSSEKDENMLRQVEQELVERVCFWSRRVLVSGCAAGAVFGYIGGEDPSQLLNPAFVSLFGLFSGLVFESVLDQMAGLMCVLTILILRHSLNQGCSACLVPAIYGFLPCASGFLFRTTRAVAISTVGVLAATAVLYAVDLSGSCTSDALDPSDRGTIIADRLVPLLMLILGNSSVLTIIVRQSQDSLLLHAQAAKSASELADMRRDVLHRVTHELRTPLNAMVGSADLLVASETMPEIDMENAMTIKRCLSTILSICDDVLLAAKSDHVKEESPFLLASCVDDVAECFVASVEAKGVKLMVEYDGDTTAVVCGMEIKLRQVLLNLVGNALKFTDSGSITIRVRTRDDTSSQDKLCCQFEVEDTGIGVNEANSDILFEAFHQGELGAVSRRHKGTGLGLTICRDLVSLMGGNIAVDGAQDQGSRFYFTLLLQKVTAGQDEPTNDIPSPAETCRILISDPEQESSTSCQSMVRSVAPQTVTITSVCSTNELLSIVCGEEEERGNSNTGQRIAFLAYDSTDADLLSIVSQMKECGWLLFLYSDRKDLPFLVETSRDKAYAVCRRPLPLVRMGENLGEALRGEAVLSNTRVPSEVKTKASAFAKSNSALSVDRDLSSLAGKERVVVPSPVTDQSTATSSMMKTQAISDSQEVPEDVHQGDYKVVVVDDTPVNVKVMLKMLSRLTSIPVISLFDGQSAVDLVKASSSTDEILFLMDWHMPGTCGISATESIRRISGERNGPRVFICMVTADIEGLYHEMKRRNIAYERTVGSKGEISQKNGGDAVQGREGCRESERENRIRTEKEMSTPTLLEKAREDEFTVLDLVAGKPVTFKSIQAILTWFEEEMRGNDIRNHRAYK